MLKINKVNKKNTKERIRHLPSKQAVEGSNPSAFTPKPLIFQWFFCFIDFLNEVSKKTYSVLKNVLDDHLKNKDYN